jgi:hypothetical protein
LIGTHFWQAAAARGHDCDPAARLPKIPWVVSFGSSVLRTVNVNTLI